MQLVCDDENRVGVMTDNQLCNIPTSKSIFAECYAMLYVVRGWMVVEVNGEEKVASKDDLIFVSPLSELFIRKAGNDLSVSCLACCQEIFERLLMENGGDVGLLQSRSQFPIISLTEWERTELHYTLELIFSTLHHQHHYKEQIVFAYVRALQLYLVEILFDKGSTLSLASHSDKIYHVFLELAQQHFRTQHKIEFYARSLHISKSYLSRIVRQRTHRTVKEILADMIYVDACYQLRNTDAQLKTISGNLGFLSLSAFSHFFKQKNGMTPSEFRK